MGQYENPSAGAFEAPPGSGQRFAPPAAKTSRVVRLGAWLVLGRVAVEWYRGRSGGTSLVVAGITIVLLVAELFHGRRRMAERGPGPYTPHTPLNR